MSKDGKRVKRSKSEREPFEPLAKVVGEADVLEQASSRDGVLACCRAFADVGLVVCLVVLVGLLLRLGSANVHEDSIVVDVACETNSPACKTKVPERTLPD